jgi:hypothetical protein
MWEYEERDVPLASLAYASALHPEQLQPACHQAEDKGTRLGKCFRRQLTRSPPHAHVTDAVVDPASAPACGYVNMGAGIKTIGIEVAPESEDASIKGGNMDDQLAPVRDGASAKGD